MHYPFRTFFTHCLLIFALGILTNNSLMAQATESNPEELALRMEYETPKILAIDNPWKRIKKLGKMKVEELNITFVIGKAEKESIKAYAFTISKPVKEDNAIDLRAFEEAVDEEKKKFKAWVKENF